MTVQDETLIPTDPTIPDVCLWWIRDDLTTLTPSVKNEKLREYENYFVKMYLKRDITFKQLDVEIRRINKEYIASYKN